MQEKPSKACFRTTRGLDAADAVHRCFFSERVFRGAHNFYELLKDRFETNSNDIAVKYFVGNKIVSVTYRQFVEDIGCMFFFFFKENRFSGSHIGLFMENRY